MPSVTLLGSATFTTTDGTKTVTATPAVGDLIVIVTAHSDNTANVAPTDDNSSGTYTLMESAVRAVSTDTLQFWVRDALISSASSTVFTHAPGTTTGGGLAVCKVTGMTRAGSAAERQSAKDDNKAGGSTPTPVFGVAALTANPVIGAVYNGANPAALTPRSSPAYSELVDAGHASPTRGLEVMSIDSGETATSIAWGAACASAYGTAAVELDSSVPNGQPGAGSLTLTGLAPSLLIGAIRQPGAAAAVASGLQPAVSRGTVLQPAAGAATITGQAPSLSRGTVTQPGAGALTVTGQDPIAKLGTVRFPSVVALSFSGQVPTLGLSAGPTPGAGALTLAGLAPIALRGSIAEPAAGALVITGLAPTVPAIPMVASPGVGALTLSGRTPALNSGPAPARLLAASAMGYLRPRRIIALDPATTAQPGTGALVITGLAPTVLRGSCVQPGAGALTIAGAAPALASGGAPGAGALLITGLAPVALLSTVTQPAAGALTISGQAPTFGSSGIVPAGALALTGQAPAALVGGDAGPAAAQLTLTGLAPVALVNMLAQPGSGALVITGQEPSGVASSPGFVPDAGELAIFGHEPTLVVTSDGILSAKYLGGQRKNVPFKPVGGKRKKDEPKKKTPEAKPSPLLLGLLARGLALPPVEDPAAAIITPELPEIVLSPIPAPTPPTLEQIMVARFDSLERQLRDLHAEIAALRAPTVAAQPTPRDPVAEAMHAILPTIGRPIDMDAPPPDDDEPPPDEPVEIAPPPPAPPPRPKMTREEIERENERRAAKAAELLL